MWMGWAEATKPQLGGSRDAGGLSKDAGQANVRLQSANTKAGMGLGV